MNLQLPAPGEATKARLVEPEALDAFGTAWRPSTRTAGSKLRDHLS
jgi:hypothetical protein